MTVQELINKLQLLPDKDVVVIWEDYDGGWTNIDVDLQTATIVPSKNMEK